MKVYGMTLGSERLIVAARNQVDAERLFGVSLHSLRLYASVTGNKAEIDVALQQPGQAYACSQRHSFNRAAYVAVNRER